MNIWSFDTHLDSSFCLGKKALEIYLQYFIISILAALLGGTGFGKSAGNSKF